ncbi:MAG: bifunctional metallophosphatase/5'-nucleotidase [Methanotrichaceae archaeon]|nr:bifunctional metallophosphatase/5'-nucleotidase [Methanotrichaceae archaeon]
MRRHLLPLVALLLLISPAIGAAEPPLRIAIMTTSDLQSQVEPFESDGAMVGGIERIGALARNVSLDFDGALLFSTGDDLMGNFYRVFQGEPEFAGMELAGYDAVCPGNHEFDYGWPLYLNATAYASFPILCANLEIEDEQLRKAIEPRIILDMAGVKVGVFGLMTPELSLLTNAGEGISVNGDFECVAREEIAHLRDEGADLVIALSHMGTAVDLQLARNVSGIDLILGGHDHIYFNSTVDGPDGWRTILVQDGMRGARLGILSFNFSGNGMDDIHWETMPLNESAGAFPEIKDLLEPFVDRYDKELEAEVGSTNVDLDAREPMVRDREAPIGDLITDAWLAWFEDADIAAINGGGIRCDCILPKGPLSIRDLSNLLPYRGYIYALNMTGEEVEQMLEISASALGTAEGKVPNGAFLQVSGIKFTIDLSCEPYSAVYNGSEVVEVINPGSRVSGIQIAANDTWTSLEPEGEYMVLVNDWLAKGGDGYALLSDIPDERRRDTTVLDIDPVIAYLKEMSPVEPVAEGRIVIINGTSTG